MNEKIAVLMGGRSLERDVSLVSGERVCDALTERGYKVLALDVTPDLVTTLRAERPDAVYIALHGKYGEDGTIQELLEFLRIPYTGPGVAASALAWNKAVSKRLFERAGIPTPAWVTFTADAFKQAGAATALDLVPDAVGGFPVAVKPAEQGSALGLARVTEAEALPEALLSALSYGDTAIVEKWIDGREIAVSVLDGPGGLRVLPPVEMVPKSGLFDFTAMYTPGETDYYVPARLEPERAAEVVALAEKVHVLLGCERVSRVDMVVGADGIPYVLEVNTSPGMTETSLLPMAAAAVGIDFQELVESMVRSTLDGRV
ncbi:MAG: D-alanine--D-alanine ligase [Coriobacteriia bacterium]|nr:D-alanine--D-alanine ligase [Coriobacteriia bacterium]